MLLAVPKAQEKAAKKIQTNAIQAAKTNIPATHHAAKIAEVDTLCAVLGGTAEVLAGILCKTVGVVCAGGSEAVVGVVAGCKTEANRTGAIKRE